jgi:putative hemolysin
MRTKIKITLILMLATLMVGACSKKATPTATPPDKIGLPNPASVNCEQKGGKLVIHDRGELGQYGVCVFEDNLQCEEWAMYRGQCPVGGIKITGYVTEAAVFCAISGGQYAVTGNSGATDEQGACTLTNNTTCDVWDYFNGTCSTNQ